VLSAPVKMLLCSQHHDAGTLTVLRAAMFSTQVLELHCINRKQRLRLSIAACAHALSSLSCCRLCTSSCSRHVHVITHRRD